MTVDEFRRLTIKQFYWILQAIRIRRYMRQMDISVVNAPHVEKYTPPAEPAGTYIFAGPARNMNNGGNIQVSYDDLPSFTEEQERIKKKYNISRN